MFDFVRVSSCVPETAVADVKGNAEKIAVQMEVAAAAGSAISVFPELCLTGYTCQDLFFQQTLLEDCGKTLGFLLEKTKDLSMTAVVGVPLLLRGQLYNCAVVLSHGEVVRHRPQDISAQLWRIL